MEQRRLIYHFQDTAVLPSPNPSEKTGLPLLVAPAALSHISDIYCRHLEYKAFSIYFFITILLVPPLPVEMSRQTSPKGTEAPSDAHQESTEHDLPPKVAAKRLIRYLDDSDVEANPGHERAATHPGAGRRSSSFSIHSVHREQGGDPTARLPIAYRTISFNIAQSQERAAFEAQGKKKTAEESMFPSPVMAFG